METKCTVCFALLFLAFILCLSCASPVLAWDSGTHRLITRLAAGALPDSPLKSYLARNSTALQRYSTYPDTVLRREYGQAEARHHYIDLEYFGDDPFAVLNPNIAVMRREFGARTLRKSGTLPWHIEKVAGELNQAWRAGDCSEVLTLSGYVSHYVGDASQPLHTTRYYDGYAGDRGVHSRFEYATDRANRAITPSARAAIVIQPITSVWPPVIEEIKDAHMLIPRVLQADRTVRLEYGYSKRAYNRALLEREGGLMAEQVARAASVLGSIWLFEWQSAGSPNTCAGSSNSSLGW
ncbi:MAG: S1/P1 nuclease [Candidatus Binataceae bacterium]